jgi:hypothetical protein
MLIRHHYNFHPGMWEMRMKAENKLLSANKSDEYTKYTILKISEYLGDK